jgi:hypothetical protein
MICWLNSTPTRSSERQAVVHNRSAASPSRRNKKVSGNSLARDIACVKYGTFHKDRAPLGTALVGLYRIFYHDQAHFLLSITSVPAKHKIRLIKFDKIICIAPHRNSYPSGDSLLDFVPISFFVSYP